MRRARLLVLASLSIAITAGCGLVTIKPAGGSPSSAGGAESGGEEKSAKLAKVPAGQARDHASLEAKYFPETVALLEQADEALAAKSFDAALDAAKKAQAALEKEYTPEAARGVASRESRQRIEVLRWVLEGEALRGLGKDVEALLAVGNVRHQPGQCRLDLRPKCNDYAEWLGKTFPGIVRSTSFVSLAPATTVPFTNDLSDLDMNVSEREIKAKKGWVAVRIQPTSKKEGKDGVTLRVDGSTSTGSYEECNKVGEVRIGGSDFDVKRCGQRGYTAHRVDFVATVPADDASRVTGAAGEEVLIVFEVKNWKKTGKVYMSGPARVAYVTPPPKR